MLFCQEFWIRYILWTVYKPMLPLFPSAVGYSEQPFSGGMGGKHKGNCEEICHQVTGTVHNGEKRCQRGCLKWERYIPILGDSNRPRISSVGVQNEKIENDSQTQQQILIVAAPVIPPAAPKTIHHYWVITLFRVIRCYVHRSQAHYTCFSC